MASGTTRSFLELEIDPSATVEDLIETMDNYAHSGAAISSRVVEKIWERIESSATINQRNRLLADCQLVIISSRDEATRHGYADAMHIFARI